MARSFNKRPDTIFKDNYVLIPLTQGQFTKVDLEDYHSLPLLREFWHASFNTTSKTFYARKNIIKFDNSIKKNSSILMHVYIMNSDYKNGQYVDHKNFDTLDNRRENLRICSPRESSANTRKKDRGNNGKDFNSKYKGVSKYVRREKNRTKRETNKWTSAIHLNRKRIHIGYFDTEEEAALAYNEKAKELFGEFAYLNVVEKNK